MKRYVVFGGECTYATGGACDYLMDFSNKQTAMSYARVYCDGFYINRWAHVWDTRAMEILEADHERQGFND